MITNAKLISITPPPAPTNADGGEAEAVPVASEVRCLLGEPKRAELLSMANKVTNVTAMLYVPLADAGGILKDGRVVVEQDEIDEQITLKVLFRKNLVLGGLSHAACYCGGL